MRRVVLERLRTIREAALPLGFVDVKVCAVAEVWSGLAVSPSMMKKFLAVR
jgi:hypothetical protein